MSDHKSYGSLQIKTVLEAQYNISFANGLSHEVIVETSVVEMFEIHRTPSSSEELMQLEQGELQE